MELTIGTKIQRLDSRLRNALRLLTGKQDTIPDLPDIRTGAGLGATAYQKPGGGIPKGDLATQVTNSLNLADSSYQKPTGGIPSSDLAGRVQNSLDAADTALQPKDLGTAMSGLTKFTAAGIAFNSGVLTITDAKGNSVTIDAGGMVVRNGTQWCRYVFNGPQTGKDS